MENVKEILSVIDGNVVFLYYSPESSNRFQLRDEFVRRTSYVHIHELVMRVM